MGPEEEGGQEGADGQEHDLHGVRVVAGQRKGRLELVVHLVHVPVEEGHVEESVEEVLEEVLAHPAEEHVPEEGGRRGEACLTKVHA